MKKIILCVLILLASANVCAADADIQQLTKAANKGDVEAQYELGSAYQYGHDVVQDYEQATYWLQKAAEQGYAEAQYNLALCYYGVDAHYEQAAYWLEKAAEQGFSAAQTNIGLCYYAGLGVPQNYKLAYMWLYIKGDQLEWLEQEMTESEIAEAQAMAAEWTENHTK